jgi:hypothetical protein
MQERSNLEHDCQQSRAAAMQLACHMPGCVMLRSWSCRSPLPSRTREEPCSGCAWVVMEVAGPAGVSSARGSGFVKIAAAASPNARLSVLLVSGAKSLHCRSGRCSSRSHWSWLQVSQLFVASGGATGSAAHST